MAKETSPTQVNFEKQIWDAACVLRGNMDASEYKTVVLGLIFLKYISDRFEEKYQALLNEGAGFEEDVDEYTSEGIFFVPANARWDIIAKSAHSRSASPSTMPCAALKKKTPGLKIFYLRTSPDLSLTSGVWAMW